MMWRRSDTVAVVLMWTFLIVAARVVDAVFADGDRVPTEGTAAHVIAIIVGGVLTCILLAARGVRQRYINIVAVVVIWLLVLTVSPESDGTAAEDNALAFWILIAGGALTVLYFLFFNVVVSKWMSRRSAGAAAACDRDAEPQ